MTRILVPLACLLLACTLGSAAETLFFVSPSGNDGWSGRIAAANAANTDGPFATLTRAQEAVGNLKAKGALTGPVTVQLRSGKYCLDKTLTLTAADSGTKEAPVRWAAYKGEKPQIIGGRLITGLKPTANGKLTVTLPEVAAGNWSFKSLFMDGKRLRRARYPNFDPSDPYRKGFLHVGPDPDPGSFSTSVACIHNPGDWMDYEVKVPAAGEYRLWVYYGALNAPFGNDKMDGRTVMIVDGGEPTPLNDLPDTGGWAGTRWGNAAGIKLTEGKHVLRWQNSVGGGLNLVMFMLSDETGFKPAGTTLPPVAAGAHRVMIPASSFVRFNGKQLAVGSNGGGAKVAFNYRPGEVKPEWAQAPGAEIHIFQSGNCRAFMEIASIKSIDEADRRVELGGDELSSGLAPGDRYFVENVASELDAPGEWFLDGKTGVLTVIPPAGCSARSELMAPTVQRVIEVLGGDTPEEAVSNLSFSGLTIRGGDWDSTDGVISYGMGTNGVVFLNNATNCEVIGCTFYNIGKDAVCIKAGSGNRVNGNDITDSAEGGINVDGSAGNVITGNHIHDIGQVYKHNGAVCLQNGASGNLVSTNMIHDVTRYGITMKLAGHDNVVEYNRIQNTSLETYDTGAIEVTQGDSEDLSGSKIRYNIVGDTIGYSTGEKLPVFKSWSIYLDSFAGGYEVSNNICYRNNNGGIMFQGGKGNHVHNNVFVDARVGQGHMANCENNQRNCQLDRNVICWSNPASGLWATGRLDAEVITADNNLYWCSAPDWNDELLTEWQAKGFDTHSVLADPQFVNPAKDDYSLKPTSPAFKLGFEKIDTSKIARPCSCRIIPQGPIFFAPEAFKPK